MDLSRHMVLAGGRFQPVKGAIDEGGNGRFKSEPRKAVSASIRGKELICPVANLFWQFCFVNFCSTLYAHWQQWLLL